MDFSLINDSICTWEIDIDNNKLTWSKNCIKVIGLPLLYEPSWNDFLALVHPEDRQQILDARQSLIERNTEYRVEFRIISGSDDNHWMRLVGKTERDADGKPLSIQGTLQNISEQKCIENKLFESESRLQEALDHARIAHWELARGSEMSVWSKQICQLMGLPPDFKPTPDKPYQLINDNDRQAVIDSLKHSFDTGEEHHLVYKIKRHDNGEERWIECRGKAVLDNHGVPEKLTGFIQDITEHKHTEKELALNAAKFESWKESNCVGIIQTNDKGDVIEANNTVLAMLGYSRQELLEGKLNWIKLTPAEFLHLDQKAVEEAKSMGYWKPFEKDFLHKCGYRIPIIMGGSIFKEDPSEYIAFIVNLSEQKQMEKKIRENEARWQFALKSCRDGIWDWNMSTNEVFYSTSFKEILGYEQNEIGNSIEEWVKRIHPDDKKQVYANLNKYLYQELTSFANEHRILSKDGSYKWILNRGMVVSWTEDHKPKRMIGTCMDITDKKIAEENLRLSAKVFSETKEGILITDANSIIIDVNPALCNITGYDREEVIGQNPRIFSSGKQNSDFYADMWKKIKKYGYWQGEVWNRKKGGKAFAELLSISSIVDEDKNVLNYIGIFTDITLSKIQQETLEHMAHFDALTQLPNRTLLADRFLQALAHSKRQENILAVCFLDLDNFKPVNDQYGHDIGDKLLVNVSECIKANIRDEDTLSRLGGDEFAILLGDIESFTHCEQMVNRIIKSLAHPYVIDNHSFSISASIGVSLYPMDDSDLDTLLRHADQAMYQAKQAGRNCYHFFNTKQDLLVTQKHKQLKEIKEALENNEFCFYYQPKVNMKTGKVFGAEALIRWNHPENGLIPPLKFLPIIEETELEIQIGDWVINEALKQLDSWNGQGIENEVSINISSYHLQSPTFTVELEKALALYPRVNSKCLQLEILESNALGDLHSISGIITTCIKELGVNIALDDFGTGYSSLTHLRNLSAKTIKIDQTFVRDMLDDPDDYAIIDGIIGLANSFNRELIAEGVETTEHGLMLLTIGCNDAQGYGIARPMPAHEIPEWLKNFIPNQEWLTCANEIRTQKEKKIKFFKITLAQWQKQFENNILYSTGSIEQWPILKRTQCHCGIWIKRARQETLFEEKWIKKLEAAHYAMHNIAVDLFNKYQQGQIETARENLNTFQTAAENLLNILGQCE